jgi:hypothetical protein
MGIREEFRQLLERLAQPLGCRDALGRLQLAAALREVGSQFTSLGKL